MEDGQQKAWWKIERRENHRFEVKILKEKVVLHDIDTHSLRGQNFYEGIEAYRREILPIHKHRILDPSEYKCVLCKGKDGDLFLEWENDYQLYQCRRCGAVSPNISVESEEKHIESVYDHEFYHEKFLREIDKQFHYRKKKFGEERYSYIVERLILSPRNIMILDLGCGAGYFISVLKDKKISYKGIEMVSHLVRYCQSRGLNVESNDLAEEPDNEYDVISMFDVLEHLTNPLSTLKILRQKLKTNGFCVAYTPNIHSVAYELMGSKQNTLLPFEHMCFFNRKSFEYLANRSGFEIHSLETFGLDIMDYLLMKEYHDDFPYTKKLKEMMTLLQGCLDKMGISNHFRATFKRV